MLHVAILINDPDKSLISTIIRQFTRSVAIHTELVFSDGVATIVTPNQVALAKRPGKYDMYHWVMIPLPDITTVQEYLIRAKAKELYCKKPKYDYLGAISGFFGSSRQDKDNWYCGELVVELLSPYIPKLNTLDWATPEDIWRTLVLK